MKILKFFALLTISLHLQLTTGWGAEPDPSIKPNAPIRRSSSPLTKQERNALFQMWLKNGGCFSHGVYGLLVPSGPKVLIPSKKAEKHATDSIPAKPVDLSGKWRVYLPAGFENTITLTAGEDGEYHLTPAHLTLSRTYRLKGTQLVSEETHKPPHGQFFWKVNSPYLITLTKQTARVGSDYTGAILFRSRDAVQKKK